MPEGSGGRKDHPPLLDTWSQVIPLELGLSPGPLATLIYQSRG